MLEIWWIRHGQSTWNEEGRWQGHADVPLTDLGRQQASRLQPRLAGIAFDQVFSSDLGRAAETASLALPDRPAQLDSRLREINFGIFEGKVRDDLTPALRDELLRWWRDPYSDAIEGGESMAQLAERVTQWRDSLTDGRIAVFTHGGVIRSCLWAITSPPSAGEWSVILDNTSITEIRYEPARTIIWRVNDTAHLERF